MLAFYGDHGQTVYELVLYGLKASAVHTNLTNTVITDISCSCLVAIYCIKNKAY